MIDISTGELGIESLSVTLGAKFTRRALFALSTSPQDQVINEPHHSYSLDKQTISGETFFVVLYFYGQKLESITLANASSEFGTSWDDWSEEKEAKRKDAHDTWLIRLTGQASHVYPWGEISSDYDPRSGGSEISIMYSWQGQPWSQKKTL